MKSWKSGQDELRVTFAGPQERWWAVEVTRTGIYLRSVVIPSGALKAESLETITVFMTLRVLLRDDELVQNDQKPAVYPAGKEFSLGYWWENWGYDIHELVSEPLFRAPDSLVVEVEARYAAEVTANEP